MSLNDCPPLLFDLHPQPDDSLIQSHPSEHSSRFNPAPRSSSPPPKGGVGDYVSPSRLTLWLKCPLAFKLRYVDGIETPPSPSQFIGRVVHAGLESWYRHRQLGLPLESGDFAGVSTPGGNMPPARIRSGSRQLPRRVAAAGRPSTSFRTYLDQIAANEPTPLAVEKSVEAPLIDPVSGENLRIPLVGVIDLVLPSAEGPLITDFKTAARGGELLERRTRFN